MASRYPSVRVAYIDEVEETGGDRHGKKVEKVYYSTLVKAVPKSVDSSEPDQKLDQVKAPKSDVYAGNRLHEFSLRSFFFFSLQKINPLFN